MVFDGNPKTCRNILKFRLMLKLCDLISLAHVDLGYFKIHCATGWPDPPLTAYFDGRFKQWQEYQNRRNFQCDMT